MARTVRPTKTQIRERNSRVPSARVYGLIISDPHAEVWRSNLAVYTDSAQAADEHWRRIGLVRGYEKLRHYETDNDDFAVAKSRPGVVFLRRAAYPGEEPWMALPEGYQWPHETAARFGPDGLLPEELERLRAQREHPTRGGVFEGAPHSEERAL